MFGGLGCIYSYFRNKRQIQVNSVLEREDTSKLKFQRITFSPKKSKDKEVVLILILISLLSTIQYTILVYMSFIYENEETGGKEGIKTSNLKFDLLAINIYFISTLSYMFLQYSLYRHQFVSLGIIFVGNLLVLFPNILDENHLGIKIDIHCFEYSLSSFRYILEKWVMEKKNYSPYKILLYEGVIGGIMCIIFGFVILLFPYTWIEVIGSTEVLMK